MILLSFSLGAIVSPEIDWDQFLWRNYSNTNQNWNDSTASRWLFKELLSGDSRSTTYQQFLRKGITKITRDDCWPQMCLFLAIGWFSQFRVYLNKLKEAFASIHRKSELHSLRDYWAAQTWIKNVLEKLFSSTFNGFLRRGAVDRSRILWFPEDRTHQHLWKASKQRKTRPS